jgi:hypothetical protein
MTPTERRVSDFRIAPKGMYLTKACLGAIRKSGLVEEVHAMQPTLPIPEETAQSLCAQIQQAHQGRWFSVAHWQCWGCTTFTRRDPALMCFSSRTDNRGCNLVNALYDHQKREGNAA